ncbi:E3 ubiquitin-protein ligase MGRN1-like [Monodelphis domestica]|uniref:E3 ubiquitin-protein ligase MGRN1-like n=1 Tax=Monodelphis domestica TaxID=13616 RepID=UPI0024E27509|nr:E3 ubiquitin-protein ligase MGRN1-like [Monodelphis domestica]
MKGGPKSCSTRLRKSQCFLHLKIHLKDLKSEGDFGVKYQCKSQQDVDTVCLGCPTEENEKPRVTYSLEFTFDADTRVAITIYCQAMEEFMKGMAVYSTKNPLLQSKTVHYKRGVSQQFSLPSFKIDFSEWKDELNFYLDQGIFPVLIQAVVDEGDAGPTKNFPSQTECKVADVVSAMGTYV